jgi:hypothetical protein
MKIERAVITKDGMLHTWVSVLILQLALIVVAIWTIIHFVRKFW